MSVKPISLAVDSDLRLSQVALERAALRAREVAEKTGTYLVVSRNGVIEHIKPEAAQVKSEAPAAVGLDVHQALFPEPASVKKTGDVKEAIRAHIRAKHARR